MAELSNIGLARLFEREPQMLLQEGARRSLLRLATYLMPSFKVTKFHRSYYRVLDTFARGDIRNLIVQAPPQHGKALNVDTPILTTKGWKRHGDLMPGDYVFGEDGKPKAVKWNSGAYIWHCREVVFADGFALTAAREHEWKIWADRDDHKGRRLEQIETDGIFAKRNRRAPFIWANAVLQMPEKELPIDPYIFGLWLGDGNSANSYISCGAEDIGALSPLFDDVRKDRTAFRLRKDGMTAKLRKLGMLRNKHIPECYLLSSVEQRRALLRGLMDTDGTVSKDGRGLCEFCQKSGQLADDVFVLLRSLGYKPTRHEYTAYLYGKDCGKKVRILFAASKGDNLFGLERKQILLDNKTTADREDKYKFFIRDVAGDFLSQVNCIEVEDGMYLAGYELVPTHNSQGSSRFLPADMLGLNPDLKIVIASYAATIATDFNRDVQRLIDCDEYRGVFPDTTLNGSNIVTVATSYLRNSGVFEIVGHQGSLRVVGRGGSLTSKTADVVILDDLYKDAAEANSPVVRAGAWDWYTKVVRTRLHNDSQQLIVFTRWHPEDIIGHIIESERVIRAEKWSDLENVPPSDWVLVNYEAIKTGEPTEIDPRQPGEALWPERHSLARLEQLRALDPVGFECLQQGNPGSAEGRLYQQFKTYVEKSDYGVYIRSGCYVDVADEGDDFLAAVSYDVYKGPNEFFNEKTQRFEPMLFVLVTDMEYTDAGTDITTVTVPRLINANNVQKAWIESNNGGSQFEKVVKKKVRALTMPFYQGSNKESRVVTNAPFVNQSVIFPFGWETRWPKAYEHLTGFLRNFPANRHDDLEDCLTGVYEKEIAPGNCQPYGYAKRGVTIR